MKSSRRKTFPFFIHSIKYKTYVRIQRVQVRLINNKHKRAYMYRTRLLQKKNVKRVFRPFSFSNWSDPNDVFSRQTLILSCWRIKSRFSASSTLSHAHYIIFTTRIVTIIVIEYTFMYSYIRLEGFRIRTIIRFRGDSLSKSGRFNLSLVVGVKGRVRNERLDVYSRRPRSSWINCYATRALRRFARFCWRFPTV